MVPIQYQPFRVSSPDNRITALKFDCNKKKENVEISSALTHAITSPTDQWNVYAKVVQETPVPPRDTHLTPTQFASSTIPLEKNNATCTTESIYRVSVAVLFRLPWKRGCNVQWKRFLFASLISGVRRLFSRTVLRLRLEEIAAITAKIHAKSKATGHDKLSMNFCFLCFSRHREELLPFRGQRDLGSWTG